MRDIKLRAWIYKEKKMVEVKSIHLGKAKIMYGYSEGPQCYGNKSLPFSECVLSQSIGIKDKNGKEIFEGDILLCENRKPYLFVEWDEELLTYRAKEKLNTNYGYKLSTFYMFDYFEVVGNIYENPELLEVNE